MPARTPSPLAKDFDQDWPRVDKRHLAADVRAAFSARSDALAMYAAGQTLKDIDSQLGIKAMTLYRCLERARSLRPDGRPWGYRALLPYERVATYERIQAPKRLTSTKAGNAGAFTQLLAQFPALDQFLRRQVRGGAVRLLPSGEKGRLKDLKALSHRFYQQCRELGLGAGDYPFNQDDKAVRSLARAVRRMLDEDASLAARVAGSRIKPESALRRSERDAPVAFDTVEFDAHKLDLRLKVIFEQDPQGGEHFMEIERAWLLVVLDVATRCVLGWNVCFGKECDTQEVIETFRRAVLPASRPQMTIPGTRLIEAGGFASLRVPITRHALWRQIRLDNARAHLSIEALEMLCDSLGSEVDFGPAYSPDDRPFIERFFGTVVQTFSRRLPGAIEPRSHAERNRLLQRLTAKKGTDQLVVSSAELEELLAMWMWNYNGTPHGSLGTATPLEALERQVLGIGREPVRLRYLPKPLQQEPRLMHASVDCVVHGRAAMGQRPYISFLHVRYTSSQLVKRSELVGQALHIHADPNDLRAVTAVTATGEILEPLQASGAWGHQIHSKWLRRAFFTAKRKKQLDFGAEADPVAHFLELRKQEAKQSKRAASQVARAQQEAKSRKAAGASRPADPSETAPPPAASPSVLDQLATGPVKRKILSIEPGFAR